MKKRYKIFLVLSYSFLVCTHCVRAQGLWSQKASLPDSARCAGVSFTIGNFGYIGLGYGSTNYHDFWQYNPTNNSWTKKATYPGKAVTWPTAFVIGNKAFVVTGANSSTIDTCYRECWVYDATMDKWAQKSNFPGMARAGALGFAIGNKGYLGTGMDSAGNVYNDFWQYDTATDSWTKKNNFPGAGRYLSTGFAVSINGYLCFGSNTLNTYNDMWQYDTTTDTWTEKSSCSGDSICGASGFAIGTNIYVGTGGNANGANNVTKFWKYNTLTDTWTQEANFLGTARDLSYAFAVGDSGYLGLGGDYSNNIFYNNWYKFYPDTLTSINELTANRDELSVYPNPFSSATTLVFTEATKHHIELYDITGREMEETDCSGKQYQLMRGNLTTGIYLLKVYNQNKQFITTLKLEVL